MPVPPSQLGSWCSFTQALGPSQDLGYAPGTSGDAGPSIGPFAGDDENDDDDMDQFIKGDDVRISTLKSYCMMLCNALCMTLYCD